MPSALAEKVYREYMEFFRISERKRRWSVFDDIPWEALDPSTYAEERALCAETFCGVEMYLPDYVGQGIAMARSCFGQSWFQASWGYEESKHSLALREYLLRSGQRSPDEMARFEESIFARRWTIPFDTPRRMIVYGAIQEQTTVVIYRKQLAAAEAANDKVLSAIYRLISRDEAAHTGFYCSVLQLNLEDDRPGTLADMLHVFARFKMPAFDLVPDYDARVRVMRSAGIDRSIFFNEVWFPILKRVAVSRQELLQARARTPLNCGEQQP